MSFKLNLNPATGFALPGTQIIYVQGRDAAVFLQAQLMNDVAELSNGQWQYTGWLNAQGRVMALFQLVRISDEHFLIVLNSLEPEWLIDSLKRFIFRSKVTFSALPTAFASGEILSASAEQPAERVVFGDLTSQLTIDMPDARCHRRLHLSQTPSVLDTHALDQWHCLDMALGWPWIDSALQNLWTPQMLSLQRLSAFSLKKGCYPGQEIVARTHYLGKSKRQLLAIQGRGLTRLQAITQNGQEIGKVVNADLAEDFGIAVLPAPLLQNVGIQNPFGMVEAIELV